MAARVRACAALIGRSLLVLWLAVTLLFVMLAMLRGNPVSLFLDPRLTPELQLRLKAAYGYDAGHLERYFRYLGNVASGDLGVSFTQRQPVARVLFNSVGQSLWLGCFSFVLAMLLCLLLLVALNQRRFVMLKSICRFSVSLMLSMPAFILAALAISILGVRSRWLPIFGTRDLFSSASSPLGEVLELVRHSLLPGFSIAIPLAALFVTYLNQRLARLDNAPFIVSARGRGISELRIFFNHKLRTILPSFVQLCGLYLPSVVGGTLIVESMFGWSGLGLLLIDGVFSRDYPLLMGGCIFSAALVIPGYELADYLRVRIGEGEELP